MTALDNILNAAFAIFVIIFGVLILGSLAYWLAEVGRYLWT